MQEFSVEQRRTDIEVGPWAELATQRPGTSPLETNNDRLMLTLDTTAPSAYPDCPKCGLPAFRCKVRELTAGIITGDYVCFAGHIWTTRWLADDHPIAG